MQPLKRLTRPRHAVTSVPKEALDDEPTQLPAGGVTRPRHAPQHRLDRARGRHIVMSKPENQDRYALRRVDRRSQELVAARGIGIGVALGLLVWAALLTVWMI